MLAYNDTWLIDVTYNIGLAPESLVLHMTRLSRCQSYHHDWRYIENVPNRHHLAWLGYRWRSLNQFNDIWIESNMCMENRRHALMCLFNWARTGCSIIWFYIESLTHCSHPTIERDISKTIAWNITRRLNTSPCYQQEKCWKCWINQWPSSIRKDFNYRHQLFIEKWSEMQSYIYISPKL